MIRRTALTLAALGSLTLGAAGGCVGVPVPVDRCASLTGPAPYEVQSAQGGADVDRDTRDGTECSVTKRPGGVWDWTEEGEEA